MALNPIGKTTNASQQDSEAEIIGLFYDSALTPTLWERTAERLVQLFDGISLNIFQHDAKFNLLDFVTSRGVGEADLAIYTEHFAAHDIWAIEASRRRLTDQPLISSDFVSDDTMANSVIYNEFLKNSTDAFYLVGGMLRLGPDHLLSFGAHRPSDAKPFSADDRAQFERLMPHLRRAIELRNKLRTAANATSAGRAILDRLNCGLVQISAAGHIKAVNVSAETILAADDGLSGRGGQLRAAHPDENTALYRLIQSAGQVTLGISRGVGGGHLRLTRPSGKQGLVVFVAPLGLDRRALMADDPAVLVFISDPEQAPPVRAEQVRELFDLTPAEARIVAALVRGDSLSSLASRFDISVNTARTLLARACLKIGVNSQVMLVRTILMALGHLRRS